MTPLWKTSVVIWTDYDPRGRELEDLAREATSGDAYCSKQQAVEVSDPAGDDDWDGTEFFGVEDEED